MGLGNPGPAYEPTRHNAGFRIAEAVLRAHDHPPTENRFGGRFATAAIGGERVGVLLPETFMNRTGRAVALAVDELEIGDPARQLVIAYDDIDLPFGRLRVRSTGGSGGHRGVESIIQALHTRDFQRVRFGVGRPPEDQNPAAYVLDPFTPTEEQALPDLLQASTEAVEACLTTGGGGAGANETGPAGAV